MKCMITKWHAGALRKGLPWFLKFKPLQDKWDTICWNNIKPEKQQQILISHMLQSQTKSASRDETDASKHIDAVKNIVNRSLKQRTITNNIRQEHLSDWSHHAVNWVDDILSYSLHIIDDIYAIDLVQDVID